MKKFLAMLLALAVLFSFAACSDKTDATNDVAMEVGSHKISTAELMYYYVDAINDYQNTIYEQYYSSFGNYWSWMLGFDATKPLNSQKLDDTGKTWADYFMDTAIENVKSVYALYDDGKANGYTLSADAQANLNTLLEQVGEYAAYYGYGSTDDYLRLYYGDAASGDSYKHYYEVCTYASEYLNAYSGALEYTDADYRAYELIEDRYDNFSMVSFWYTTMQYSSYRGEGTKGEDGTTTWTEEENDQARAKMKADMEALMNAGVVDKESFDKAIQAWEINQPEEGSTSTKLPTASEAKDVYFQNISLTAETVQWLKKADRKAGDLNCFEVLTYAEHEDANHEHSAECGCASTVDGYVIVLFTERNDQIYKMVNVRHILVKFEGGTTKDGVTTYTDEEKAKAKAEAEQLLQQWQEGEATEESFGKLANEKSDDQGGKVTNGGIYEEIYKGQMVANFENWCFDAQRQPGDTGLVETEYGWHVMYFSSFSELTMRDKLIDYYMRNEATEKWMQNLVANVVSSVKSLERMEYDYVVSKS